MAVEDQVTDSLFQFLHSHVKELKLEDIDEMFLSYVVSILQDLTSGCFMDEEAFDVEAFYEMIVAYLPETECIPPDDITEWMFTLAKDQRMRQQGQARIQLDLRSVIDETANKGRKISESGSLINDNDEEKKGNARISESSDYSSSDGVDSDDFKQMIDQLMEMFPLSCDLEVSTCLTLMSGDMERTAQLIIHRQESELSLQPTDRKIVRGGGRRVEPKVDDKSIKDRIMGKYGFVDQAEDGRYHRPTVKREEEKKMTRYRDGKIVSTKGERYTQVTKAESDEMKKSYVNL